MRAPPGTLRLFGTCGARALASAEASEVRARSGPLSLPVKDQRPLGTPLPLQAPPPTPSESLRAAFLPPFAPTALPESSGGREGRDLPVSGSDVLDACPLPSGLQPQVLITVPGALLGAQWVLSGLTRAP